MEHLIDDVSGNLDQAARRGDVDRVVQLLQARDRADLEAAVKQIAELQNRIFQKEAERESLQRELEHLSEPVTVALQGVASALETLEERRIDLAHLQARQGIIDLGLKSSRDQITELREELARMMEAINE